MAVPLFSKPSSILVPNNNPIRKGLVLDLPMFERGGTRVIDLSSFKTNGVFVGSPTWTVGQGGVGIQIDNASTDRITVTTQAGQNNIHTISVETLAINDSGMSNGGRLFHKGATGVHANRYWEHGEVDAGNMYFAGDWSGGQGAWRFTAGAPSTGVVHHIVSTYNDSSTTNDPVLYLDGVSVGVTEVLGPSGSRSADTAIAYIGGSVTATESWKGKIFYVRVWNRILKPNEVAYLYTHPYDLYNFQRLPSLKSITAPIVTTTNRYLRMMMGMGR